MTEQADKNTCRICMHEINNPTTVKGCSHAFCYECIHQWTSSRKTPLCPICREAISTLVLADGIEEAAKPGTTALPEELDLSCLDHRYFLGEVGRLISRANSVHNQLYRDAYGCGRKGGSRQSQQSLDSVHEALEALSSYRSSLQDETRFDPEVLLQELYRLDRQVTSAQAGNSGQDDDSLPASAAAAEEGGQQQQYATAAGASQGQQHIDEDYWDDYHDGSEHDNDWHEGLAKTPGRRPSSRHVNNGIKTRLDRGVRSANQQRQQRR
eukprot:GHUV01009048.1.p1 GENE.GHUV01009048.1~~GHUV01009048.1.p1  ORF type:complete len:268 (+),score=62.65 GHUV01009048.1:277-1080(+)